MTEVAALEEDRNTLTVLVIDGRLVASIPSGLLYCSTCLAKLACCHSPIHMDTDYWWASMRTGQDSHRSKTCTIL